MRFNKINYLTDLSLSNNQIFDLKIDNDNYTDKNVLIVKDDLTNLPTASVDYLDVTFYYVGTSTTDYLNNHIYKCVFESDAYLWKSIDNHTYYGTTEPADDLYLNGDYFIYYNETEEEVKKDDGTTEKVKVNTLKKILVKADDKWTSIKLSSSDLDIDSEKSKFELVVEEGTENKNTLELTLKDSDDNTLFSKKAALSEVYLDGLKSTYIQKKGLKSELTTDSIKVGELFLATDEKKIYTKLNDEIVCLTDSGIVVTDTLPIADEKNVDKVYFLTTDSGFYKCVNDGGYKYQFLGYAKSVIEYSDDITEFHDVLYHNTTSSSLDYGLLFYDNSTKTLKSIIRESKIDYLSNTNISSAKKGDLLVYTDSQEWVNKSNLFQSGSTTKVTVGNLLSDTDVSDKTPLEVLNLILFGTADPGNVKLNDVTTTYKKGETATLEMTATCTAPTGATLTKIEWYKGDELVHEETLSGESATPTYTYEGITESTEISAKCYLSNGTSSEAKRSIKFVSPCYYGNYGETLSEILLESRSVTLTFTGTMVRPVYKYPSEFGTLVSITNYGGSDSYLDSFALTTETIDSVTYNVYTKIIESTHDSFQYRFD